MSKVKAPDAKGGWEHEALPKAKGEKGEKFHTSDSGKKKGQRVRDGGENEDAPLSPKRKIEGGASGKEQNKLPRKDDWVDMGENSKKEKTT